MPNRLKKLWKASKLPESVLDDVVVFQGALERGEFKLAEGAADKLDDSVQEKGEFLPDMSEAEVLEYERNERLGWKKLINHLPWKKPIDVIDTDVSNT